jgi:hypothetical protein
MCFQLTDESDPFFLYSLRITEEEFQVDLLSFHAPASLAAWNTRLTTIQC